MDLLIEGCRLLGIPLNQDQITCFRLYAEELVRWNRQVNLTSITEFGAIQTRHFLDSISCLLAFPGARTQDRPPYAVSLPSTAGTRVLDIGAGAGFPGLPLKIVCPEIELTLLESVGKKTRFLDHIVWQLGLTGVEVVTARAEEFGRQPARRETYDVVVSRAVAGLAVLAELGLPFARLGGRLIAPKKGAVEPEIRAARWAIEVLGGRLGEHVTIELEGLLDQRYLIVVDKIASSPAAYPRRPGVPARRPLG